jgi:hypothetical protein
VRPWLLTIALGFVACGAPEIRSSTSPCPPRSSLRSGACACDAGVTIAGACVPRAVAASVCDGDLEGAACARSRCPDGQIPVAAGPCVPLAGLRASASHPWIVPDERGALACPAHSVAHARSGSPRPALLCLSETACLPGTSWDGARCTPEVACAPGRVFSAEGKVCVPVTAPDARGGTVDLARWVAVAIGVDGGPGSALLCGALGQNPHLAGVLDRAVPVDLTFTVDVPGNDATNADVRVHATPREMAALATPISGVLASALRGLGSTTSATRARTTVRCVIGGAVPPERVAIGEKL